MRIKTNGAKALSILLALLLLIPGASGLFCAALAVDPAGVTVNFAAYDPNSGFLALDQALRVTPGTAAKYGLENAAAGHSVGGVDHGVAEDQVTPLDAIVAMHEKKYGDAFTEATWGDYLQGGSSYITGMFGVTGSVSYAVNDDLPMGEMSDGYAINEYPLRNNESVYFFIYADDYVGDYLAGFDKKTVTVSTGESFTLTLTAFMAMEAMFANPGTPTPEEHSTLTVVPDAAICLVDPATGAIGECIGTTDDDGVAELSFPQTGEYIVTAQGFEPDYDYPITAPICRVTVNGPEYLSTYKFTNGTGASSAVYPMAPSEDPAYDFVVTVPDYTSSFAAWATLSEAAPAGSTITVEYVNTSGTARTQTITSGKTTGQNLAMCVAGGSANGNNTLKLKVGSGADMQEYKFKVVRNITVSALSAEANGTALILDPAFSRDTAAYSSFVPATVSSVNVNAAAFASGASLTIGGIAAVDGRATVALSDETTDIAVVASAEGAVSGAYTLTVTKVAPAEVSFNLTPADANVMVFDAAGAAIPADNGVYTLMSGVNYTYTAAKAGYVGEKTTFAAATGTIDVTLAAAEPNPAIDPNTSAQWKNFRNSDVNMGITTARTPKTPEATELKWHARLGTGYATAPSVQIIVDDALVVMCANGTLYKMSLADGSVLQSAAMAGTPNYGYTPPTYAEGMIFVPLSGGRIQAFNAKTLESLWVYTDAKGGQSLTPITYSDGYIYTGFWNGEDKPANYACISVTDEDPSQTHEAKIATWTKSVVGGFYWAGALAFGDAVIFGTDDGTGNFNSPTSHLYSVNKYTGAVISELPIVGDQRSNIAYDAASGRIFFTTKCGYLYSAALDAATGELSDLKGVNHNAQCTGTPIVYAGKAYFGTGSGISTSGSTGNFVVCDAETLEMDYAVGLKGYPQASLLLSTAYFEEEGLLYFYSTYNMTPGGLSLIKVDPTKNTADGAQLVEIYDAAGFAQYCIASPICDENGNIYYKNDGGNVLAVGATKAYLTDLVPNVGVMSSAFAGATLNYELVVPVGTESVTFAITASEGSSVTVNGAAPAPVALSEGTATAEIVVTNEVYTRIYTVGIREVSTNSALSELRVNESNAYASSVKAITPAFAADTLDYAAVKLSSGRTFTNVWPTAADANATVKVLALSNVKNCAPGDEIAVTAQNSGHNRYAIYYADGSEPCAVEIVVTSEEGLDKTSYSLILTKSTSVSADTQLSVLKEKAKLDLAAYKDAADYRETQQAELTAAINAGKDAIEAAADAEAVAAALVNAKTAIDAIKTDAELAAEELAAAKAAAKTELESYQDPADYREAQQAELTVAVNAGKDAIDAAENTEAVATALADAKTAIDAIKTDAQLTDDELAAAKADAKSELAAYKNAADYREAQQAELAAAVNAGKDAIDAAENTEAVATALADAKTAIDAIKTDAELTAEELAATKADAKSELAAYKNAADYREAEQEELSAAISVGKEAIDAAQDEDAVAAALANAKEKIDAIKTAAELAAEEEEAEKLCPFCHEEHKGPIGKLIQFFHKILQFFKVMFNKDKGCN